MRIKPPTTPVTMIQSKIMQSKTERPLISVLMSVYNGERYLHEAIGSILSQTYKNLEFIIIDDSSTDGTTDIIKSYSDKRISYVRNQQNLGLTKSLNKGIALARGKYIARQDADDVSYSHRLECQYEVSESSKLSSLVCSHADVIGSDGLSIKEIWDYERNNKTPEAIYYALHFGNCLCHSTVFSRKSVFESMGGYNENFRKVQDYELWTRLMYQYPILKISEPLAAFRKHNEGVTFGEEANGKQSSVIACEIELCNIERLLGKSLTNSYISAMRVSSRGGGLNNTISSIVARIQMNKAIIKKAPTFLNKKALLNVAITRTLEMLRNHSNMPLNDFHSALLTRYK